jgi:hypothetical protein
MRTILFVLALLGAVVGRGQIVLDWYSSAAPAAGLLLDDYPNAAAAYSLRLLNSAYTGNCIQVRRASNNDLQDIGFAGGVLDTAALKTFCASTNCFVRTWYDQSLNARNATQTTNANQPQIVSGGAVFYFDGRPSVGFYDLSTTTVGQFIDIPLWHANTDTHVWSFITNGVISSVLNIFASIISTNPADRGFLMALGVNASLDPRTFTRRSVPSGPATQTAPAVGDNYIRIDNANRTTISQWINNGSAATANDSNTNFSMPTNYRVGSITVASAYSQISISEMIFYNSDQSSNRTGIRDNINAYFNIY